jgi:hypothetical protein
VERFARLEVFTYEYTYENMIDMAQSPKVSGTRDWTHVSVVLDTGESAYVMPQLVLYDIGTAWFDDLKLEKLS